MATERVDPEVFRRLDRLAADAGDPTVPVVIEHVLPADGDAVDLGTLTERVHRLQRGIFADLNRLGVRDARGLVLANAVVAELNRRQVLELADNPDVRRIHLARPEQVTTAG